MIVDAPSAPHLDRAAAEEIDRDLARLTRSDGRMALELGETMERFARLCGPAKLGYSSRKAYTAQNLGQPSRWVGDMCALARRLEDLPLIRAALAEGAIGRSMADVLSRFATADTELVLLLDAKRSTVAAMKKRLKAEARAKQAAEAEAAEEAIEQKETEAAEEAADQEDDEDDDSEQLRSTIEMTVPLDHLWAFQFIRFLMDAGFDVRGDDAMEYLLAEAAVALDMLDPDLGVPVAPPEHPNAAWRHEQRELDAATRKTAEEEAEAGLDLSRDDEGVDVDDDENAGPLTPIDALSDDVYILHDKLQQLGKQFARRDLELGQLADTFWAACGWKTLGYATERQYCRERLGLSQSSMRKRIKLARDAEQLPAVTKAIEDGDIGFEIATLVAGHTHSVRSRKTETAKAWLARARERTVKHLREELDVARTRVRLELDDASLAPPDEAAVATYQKLREMALSGEMFVKRKPRVPTGFQIFVTLAEMKKRLAVGRTDTMAGPIGCEPPPPPFPSRGGDGPAPMRKFRLNLPDDLARWYRRLQRDWDILRCEHDDLGTSFLEFLCMTMATTWRPQVEEAQQAKWSAIYARDGYRCTSPVCSRRDITLHHLKYRSRGGGHEPSNTTSLCSCCHLELLHDAHALRAEPPAETIRWLLGKVPQLEVVGRELTRAA